MIGPVRQVTSRLVFYQSPFDDALAESVKLS